MLRVGNPILFPLSPSSDCPCGFQGGETTRRKTTCAFSPIRARKQKANHVADLCMLKQGANPRRRGRRGCPPGASRDGEDQGDGAPLRFPAGLCDLPALSRPAGSPGVAGAVSSGSGASLPPPLDARPSGLPRAPLPLSAGPLPAALPPEPVVTSPKMVTPPKMMTPPGVVLGSGVPHGCRAVGLGGHLWLLGAAPSHCPSEGVQGQEAMFRKPFISLAPTTRGSELTGILWNTSTSVARVQPFYCASDDERKQTHSVFFILLMSTCTPQKLLLISTSIHSTLHHKAGLLSEKDRPLSLIHI